jgi:GH24 family phage-related lysozyme (muramidase)
MAYMDDQALEREKSKQAMIAGKQPLLGDDTSRALHALGVNLGVVPPGTQPSQMTQLLESLLKGPNAKSIHVDEQKPLQVQPLVGQVTSSLQRPAQADDSIGETISGGFSAAKDKALQQKLQAQQQVKPPTPPQMPQAPGAPPAPGANRARLSGKVPLSKVNDLAGVDPQVVQAAKEWAQLYNEKGGPHTVQFTSGKREGDPREHGRGNAFDMQLIDKSTGKALENYRTNDPKTFAAYQDYANGFHQYLEANHPDLAKRHRWGGYFSGDRSQYGSLDQMHHDFAGDRIGMAGGSWKDGLSPQQAKLFPGLNPGGGLAGKPPMAPGRPTLAAPTAAAGPHAAGVPVELTEWVAKKENFTNKAFADYGTTNIGYGTAANGRTTIDEPTARAEMNAELSRHLATIDALNPNTPPAIRNSLASLGFNTGGAALKGTGLADAVKRGDWKQAKEIFVQYDKVTDASGAKKPLHGLTIRRGQEAQAFDNPNYYKDPKAGTTAAQDWGGKQDPAATPKTPAPAQAPAQPPQAEAKPAPAAAPAAAPTPSAPSPGAAAIAATEPEQLLPESSQDVPAAAPMTPVTPAPAVAAPAAPAVAAAPVKPPAAPPPAPPPVAKPAPPAPPAVNPAHALLDTKVIELVKRGDPSKVSQVPDFIGNKTLREALNTPFVGSQIAAGVQPYLPKMGITQQQFDAAVKEGAPKPAAVGKRSDLDLGTSGATDFSASKRMAPAPAVDPNAPTLDPLQQKPVQNEDGSISTVRTIGVEDQGKEVNIPTVPAEGGRVMSDADARQRYVETGNHLGKFDTVEQAGAAAEKLHQDEAARISEQPKGQQPAMTPEIAKALTDVYKDESRVAPDMPAPPADAMPVLPAQPATPAGGAAGGLSLAPPGLSSIPTGSIPGQGASQGGSIALAGMLPPIENATYSSPLLNQTAASGGMVGGLSPISPQVLGGWGWGGGNIGAGLDWGGGGGGGGFDFGSGGFSMPIGSTGGW